MVSDKYQLDPIIKLYDPTFYTSCQTYSIPGKFDNRYSFGLVMRSEDSELYFNQKSAAFSFGVTSFALTV